MARQEMLFSDYLGVILRHKLLILLMGALVFTATQVWTTQEQPVYGSTTRIKIQRLQTFAEMFSEIFVTSGDPLENYIHELTSYNVLQKATLALHEQREVATVAQLRDATQATRIGKTDLIDIAATGNSPSEARLRAEAVVAAFRQHHDEILTRNAQQVSRYMEDFRRELEALEAKEESLRQDLGTQLLLGADSSELKYWHQRLVEATLKLQELVTQKGYTEKHAEVVATRQNISELQDKVRVLTGKDLDVVKKLRQYELYKRLVDEKRSFFATRYEEARIAEARRGEVVIMIEPPENGRQTNRHGLQASFAGALLGMILGMLLAFVLENFDTSFHSLSEIEAMFGLPILGVVPRFSASLHERPMAPENLWQRLRYSAPLQTLLLFWKLMADMLQPGRQRRNSLRQQLVVPFYPRSPATEGYRTIRANLQLNGNRERPGTFLVTSPGPGEGKTTTLVNMGLAFAQAGHSVLMVGANMRRPSLYRIFGLPRERGLADILLEDIAWRQAIKDYNDVALGDLAAANLASAPGMDKVSIITCGDRIIQPAEWLSLPLFAELVQEWRDEFDVVLIDSPPMLPVPDPLIMASAVGQVLLVYRMGSSTSSENIRNAVSALHKTSATVRGLVLNGLRAYWTSHTNFSIYQSYYGRSDQQ